MYVNYKEAGHFIGRSNMSLRWDEKNVNGQCGHCNQTLNGNPHGYEYGITDRYGKKELDRIKNTGYSIKLYKSYDLERMIDEYREKTKNLV